MTTTKDEEFKDTVCVCGHWYEEHEPGGDRCASLDCDCAVFVFSPELNTAEAIADRGSDGHQPGCVCTLCRERPGWSEKDNGDAE